MISIAKSGRRPILGCCVLLLMVFVSTSLVSALPIDETATLAHNSQSPKKEIGTSTVLRVLRPKINRMASAFLHKSGKVITAAHVVYSAQPSDVFLVTATGKQIEVESIVRDVDLDLALLTPKLKLSGNCLPISTDTQSPVGCRLALLGYPTGYGSNPALACVGYLSGRDFQPSPSGKRVERWVVNAAINLGNSGGPLVRIETGEVIGVVCSKMAPIPEHIEVALDALKQSKSDFMYTRTYPDGSTEQMSTAQVLEEVLQYLRSQTQLVLGHAVTTGDLRLFLEASGVDP